MVGFQLLLEFLAKMSPVAGYAMMAGGFVSLWRVWWAKGIIVSKYKGDDFYAFFAILVLCFWAYAVLSKPTFTMKEAMVGLGGLTLAVATTLATSLVFRSYRLTRKFGKIWVKALDFPYLILGFLGISRVLNASPHLTEKLDALDTVGMVMLAVAIGIRLAKSIIEVFFDWYLDLCLKVDSERMGT